jgi:Leucine rich repeat N-terminal domain
MQALPSWNPSRPVCGGWQGVTCNTNGDVTGL